MNCLKPPSHKIQQLDFMLNPIKKKACIDQNNNNVNISFGGFKIQVQDIGNDNCSTLSQQQNENQQNNYIKGRKGDGIFQIDVQQEIKQKQQKISSFFCTKDKQENPQNDKKQYPRLLIAAWNVNNIQQCIKSREFTKYLKFQDPHILCLSETKLSSVEECEQIGQHIPQNYCFQAWNFSTKKICGKNKEGYSGTAIISKTPPIDVVFGMGVPEHDKEGRIITFEFKDFYLVTCYTPNSGKRLQRLDYRTKRWDACFSDFVGGLKYKKTTIISGDLNTAPQNIDLSKATQYSENFAGFTPQEKLNFNNLLDKGWIDTFRHLKPKQIKYSYWKDKNNNRKKNFGWRLDYFLVDKQSIQAICQSNINNEVYGSDHCPVEIILDLQHTFN